MGPVAVVTAEHPDRPGRARAPQAARRRPTPYDDRQAGYRDPQAGSGDPQAGYGGRQAGYGGRRAGNDGGRQAGNGADRPSDRRRPVRDDDPGPARRPGASREDPAAPPRLTWPDRVLRGLAGVLAGGLVVLALGMVVVWVGADRYGLPGPGAGVVVGHLVGAVLAVAGQRVADRRPDRTGTLAAAVVVGLVAFVLGFAWFL